MLAAILCVMRIDAADMRIDAADIKSHYPCHYSFVMKRHSNGTMHYEYVNVTLFTDSTNKNRDWDALQGRSSQLSVTDSSLISRQC